MYKIERLPSTELLLQQAADRFDLLSSGIPFRQSAWLGSWWEHFGSHAGEPYLVAAWRPDGRLCGLLPLYRHQRGEGRTLSAIGDGDACTDHLSALTDRSDDAPQIAAEIGRWLAAAARSADDGWDIIDFDGLVAGDAASAALVQGLQAAGALTHVSSRMNLWFRATTGSWDDYVASVSRTRRRQLRRFSSIATTNGLELMQPQSADQTRVALDALIDLHQRRWVEAGQAGSFASAPMRAFIHDAAQRLFQLGQLRLPTLCRQGQVIAAELHLIGQNRVMYCYSTGMDPAFAELEPGRMLHTETLRFAYDNALAGIDLLRGDEPYKQRMGAMPRAVARLRAVAPALLPRLRHAAWRTRFELKQWIRRRTGRMPLAVLDLADAPATAEPPVTDD